MPNRWLVKTDPRRLSFERFLVRRVLTWRGVSQPASHGHLARMRRGDEVLVYLTGAVRAVVGTARVRRGAYPDPRARGQGLSAVDLASPAALGRPVPLQTLRAVPSLAGWDLLRIPRCTVMPVPARAWQTVLRLGRAP